MNNQVEEVEIIRLVENGKVLYHLKPAVERHKADKVWIIPKDLFQQYVSHRRCKEPFLQMRRAEQLTHYADWYTKRVKVKEGERVKFGDGSVTALGEDEEN